MQEIKKQVQKTIIEEKTAYIAFDGTEFKCASDCENYEYEKRMEAFFNRDDVEVKRNVGAPCNGGYWSWDHSYIWVKPNTASALIDLNETFEGDYFCSEDTAVGKWTCIEFDYDDIPSSYSEDDTIKAIKAQLGRLGYKVTITKKTDK